MRGTDGGADSYSGRLEGWARESAELHADMGTSGGDVVGEVGASEEIAMRRYRRSSTRPTRLPNPLVSAYRYEMLTRRRRALVLRLVGALLALPVLVGLCLWVDPDAAQIALGALLVVPTGVVLHHVRALTRLERERHVRLQGGLADAWRDWLEASAQVEAFDGASQARAALSANEARMQTLVAALGEGDASSAARDSAEHAAASEWVYRSAATAVALARAAQLQSAVEPLTLAPDGDTESLEQALEGTRSPTRESLPGQ